MLGFVAFVVGVLIVGALLFLGASLLLGRGEAQLPDPVGRSSAALPAGRPVTGEDVRALRLTVAPRGYRMDEIDWLLARLAAALEDRDAELDRLRPGAAAHPVLESGPNSAQYRIDPGVTPVEEKEAPGA